MHSKHSSPFVVNALGRMALAGLLSLVVFNVADAGPPHGGRGGHAHCATLPNGLGNSSFQNRGFFAGGGPLMQGVGNQQGFGPASYGYNRNAGGAYLSPLNTGFNPMQASPLRNPSLNSGFLQQYGIPNGNGLWQQTPNSIGQVYDNGGYAYRNWLLGQGFIGWQGMSAEDIISSFTN